MTLPSYLDIFIEEAIWHTEIGGWVCIIRDGTPEYPFLYDVVNESGGQGGPAGSFEEALKEIETFLAYKGLSIHWTEENEKLSHDYIYVCGTVQKRV